VKGEWKTVKIEDIAERIAMGPFGSSIKVETFVPEGVPVISGQHLHGFKVDDRVGFNFITEEHAERLKNANVRRGDVVFTHRGNIGQVARVPEHSVFERYVVSQSQFYLRPDTSKVLPEYIVAYFKTPEGQHKLLANASQVGVPSIAQPVTYLRSLEIPLPPLPEQHAIAHILGTLDNKIELNRRMSETLEHIARALFESWFIRFDPVRRNIARKRRRRAPSSRKAALPSGSTAAAKPPAAWPPIQYKVGDMVATREAYNAALARLGEVDRRIVAMDGDTKNSTFAEKFAKKFLDRFVECYIAEQNLVAVAVGFGARGKVPFASTFASFLTRACYHIRVAGISRANLKLVGSHVGVSIGQDGPSQMGLEDLAMMRAVAGELSAEGVRVHRLAVRELPRSGKAAELLAHFGINADAIAAKVRALV